MSQFSTFLEKNMQFGAKFPSETQTKNGTILGWVWEVVLEGMWGRITRIGTQKYDLKCAWENNRVMIKYLDKAG